MLSPSESSDFPPSPEEAAILTWVGGGVAERASWSFPGGMPILSCQSSVSPGMWAVSYPVTEAYGFYLTFFFYIREGLGHRQVLWQSVMDQMPV